MAENKVLGFNDILGNDMIKDHFQKAIENQKVSHAYILTGEAGPGRKSIANAFSMALLIISSSSSSENLSEFAPKVLVFIISHPAVM